jgi:protein tyrosine phosphatase (PTP) superfamily phosphohydrolase (DUF442 family)
VGLTGALGWQLLENFHAVIPDAIYRSGQLSPSSLQQHIERYQIRSVINLRGKNANQPWYQEECAMAAHCGARHYDMPTDSSYPPLAEELREWIRVLQSCEKPVLIHCQSGIDRTGLVAVVGILQLDPEGDPARAREQLSWHYGHLPWRSNHYRHLAFVDLYTHWLQQQQSSHDRERFLKWAREVYVPETEWVLEAQRAQGTASPRGQRAQETINADWSLPRCRPLLGPNSPTARTPSP